MKKPPNNFTNVWHKVLQTSVLQSLNGHKTENDRFFLRSTPKVFVKLMRVRTLNVITSAITMGAYMNVNSPSRGASENMMIPCSDEYNT